MSHLNPGLISAYNSLTDKHLAGYFSNIRIRRHLQRAGLITRSGRIVPDKEYRHKQIQRTHQRHIRECLAQAIFHQVLEMERVHHIEIKRRLEEFARRERVNKIKVECSKRYEEDITRILSPHPPTGARGFRKQYSGPEGEHSESSESPGSSRPNTAPEKMQRPVRLKPIHSNSTTATVRYSSPYRHFEPPNENDQQFNSTMESRRRLTRLEASHGISPYCLPVINNFVTPVPPATKRKESGAKVTASSTVRGRRFRPATSFSGADISEDPPMLRSSVQQSRVSVSMMYLGKTVHLSHDLTDRRDEVKVFQQHCGGENLCVYKGMLHEGETFRFISRRHRGFPFSLTFFLNGLQVERVSSCCEFKHRKGSRLGSMHRHFGFSSVDGASPCYKCIIAMGLDKKSTPPPKRVKEDGGGDKSVFSPKDAHEKTREDPASHSECETSQSQRMETKVKEETAAEEDKVGDDYEEDFEADNEGPAEDAEANVKKSPSPSCDSQRQVKERDASETEDDGRDEDIKSTSASSFSDSDREESDAEADKDSGEDEKAETPEEVDQEVLKPDEMDEPEEATPAEIESAVAKDIQNSAGDSTELDISDTSVPSGNKNKQNDDTSEDKEVEKMVDQSKQEEQERAKSVQEKLAEAILKESHCSSEPELSDTTTEEEEEFADKGPQRDNKDVVPEKSVICTEQQQILIEETSDPKEREDETKQELHQNSDGNKDERVKVDEEDEKAESVENTAANNKTEDAEDRGQHPVGEEEMYDKTSELREDAAYKSTDAAEKEDENKEKTAVDADTQPNKPGEEATGYEEHESSVSEPNKKTDERAVSNNAEVEATTAGQTMEMKAEASEERVALRCEETPVTNTDKRQQGDSEGEREAASETEVTAENSSSSLDGSGDTTVEKAAETNEDKAKDESNKDDIKEEEVSAGGAGKEKQERCDLGEEQTERSEKIDDKVEDKSEDGGEKAEKQTNPDELAEADDSEEHKVDDKDNESKSDSNNEGKANEQAEKSSEEDKAATEERADESETTEKDEDSKCVKNENHMEETEENRGASDETIESEKISETNTAANEEKGDEVEKNQNENDAEPSEAAKNKYNKESEEIEVTPDETVPEEEIPEIAEESEERTDAVLKEDNVKIADENSKSENVDDSEAANIATIEETVNKAAEVEDVKKERGSEKSENGEVDAENGETSSRAENNTQDEEEAQTETGGHVETAEHREDETKTKEAHENESKEVKDATVDSAVEKHEDDKVDQAPDTDVAESEAKEGDDKKDESTKYKSESETSVTDIKEEFKSDGRKDCEESKQDENGNISDRDHENRDSDLIKNSSVIQSDVTDVKAASLGDQEQSSIIDDLDGTATKLEESTKPAKTDGYPQTNDNTAVVDLSAAADGENEDTEAQSKASEEGASVLLKPQTQSSPISQNNKAENTEESVAGSKDIPEALAGEDNTDLVKNWVTMHQASKYFETFVEPLEDLRESNAQESNTTESTKLSRSESPLKMMKTEENAQQKQMEIDVNESRDKTQGEAIESELKSNHSEDGKLNTVQAEEETDVKESEAESQQNDNKSVEGEDVRSGEHKGSRGSLEEGKIKESSMQDNPEQSDTSKTEVESIAGTHHSVTSGRQQIVSEIQTEEKAIDKGPELSTRQTFKEVKDVLPSSETEGHRKYSTSPEGLSERDRKEQKDTEETLGKGREVTEITDFTEDGSQEDSHHRETQPKSSDVSINGDRRETQMIQDIQHTLSKDRLSIFSADETLFGRSSYPLLTAARTESEH